MPPKFYIKGTATQAKYDEDAVKGAVAPGGGVATAGKISPIKEAAPTPASSEPTAPSTTGTTGADDPGSTLAGNIRNRGRKSGGPQIADPEDSQSFSSTVDRVVRAELPSEFANLYLPVSPFDDAEEYANRRRQVKCILALVIMLAIMLFWVIIITIHYTTSYKFSILSKKVEESDAHFNMF